ncbi:Lipopolysaccharide export system permease protein LptF [Thalassocella blandensis]|nr:Lipopolysaccharide export system permease protein LptF [Thalassocella blandensis]
MIIFRYLAREVLTSMFAVSFVLLLIIFSARFVKYLAEAAAGKLDAGVLLTLMAYKSLGFMELILPLGLFIGILMSYGRLYLESEMTVLFACGLSNKQLLNYTLATSFFVAIFVALLATYLGPHGVNASEKLLAEQRNRTDFETLKPARFNDLESGKGVTYAESISKDKKTLNHVFIAELAKDSKEGVPTILMAESGETIIDSEFGEKYLLLKNGKQYKGQPGGAKYETVEFEQLYQLLPEPDYAITKRKATDGMTTLELYQDDSDSASAALQWRLSLPVLVMIVGFLAVPLSRTQPRKGRYGKLLPAILIYIIYLVCLNAARGVMDNGSSPVAGLLWWIHGVFFILAVVLYNAPRWFNR